jgi:dihydroflavonol-4-reductase
MTVRQVLVLGTGFIGGQVARRALDRGWQVRGLRRRTTAVGDLAGVELEWVDGDLSDPESLARAMEPVDVIFHAAGYYPTTSATVAEHVRRGVGQIEAVLGALEKTGGKRLVYTSSLSTLGWPHQEEARPVNELDFYIPGSLPRSAYYEVKAAMEQKVLAAAADGVSAVIVNPTAVFGPGDVHLTTARVLVLAGRGLARIAVPATLNVVDVRDVAEAHVVAAEVGGRGERYILGGWNMSVAEFLSSAAAIAGVPGPRWEVPVEWLDWMAGVLERLPPLASTGGHLRAMRHWPAFDSRKAQRALGLRPRPLEITLRHAFAWLQDNGHLRLRSMV